MSVETIAIIPKGVTLIDIINVMKTEFDIIDDGITSFNDSYFQICFFDGKFTRRLSISFGDTAEHDFNIPGTLLSLGCWGSSVDIITVWLNEFGGYLIENEVYRENLKEINLDLFNANTKQLTELDKFKCKVISKLDIKDLNVVLDLCEEYKKLNL